MQGCAPLRMIRLSVKRRSVTKITESLITNTTISADFASSKTKQVALSKCMSITMYHQANKTDARGSTTIILSRKYLQRITAAPGLLEAILRSLFRLLHIALSLVKATQMLRLKIIF